jgi:hypothetical protein
MPNVYKMSKHPKDKGYKEEKKNKKKGWRMIYILNVLRRFGKYVCCPKPIAPHVTCCASCPKPKNKTNIFFKTNQQNKTRNETNLDNTCTFFLLKNTQKTRGMRKKTKEKGLESEMYGVKAWLGNPKELSHFIFIGPPHLNMLKLNDTFILKVLFYS